MTTNPPMATGGVNRSPPSSSSRRPIPIGNQPDASRLPATAIVPASSADGAMRNAPTAASCDDVKPLCRRTAVSGSSRRRSRSSNTVSAAKVAHHGAETDHEQGRCLDADRRPKLRSAIAVRGRLR